jgi:formylglycine-generating enzyme required for sulfatase activity
LKALSRHPSDRFAIAKDLAEEVRWLIQNQLSSDNSNTLRTPAGAPNADRVGLDSGPQRTPSELPAAGELDSANRTGPLKVVPKGLRSFDAGDADFFLELLPGPFDRDGLPESIRFWKSRIEATDIDKTFRVGLVYGPSGCGKSSLMKAGLLPRLSTRIERVYVEATPDDTPARLLKELQKRIPDLSATNLADALSMIRRRNLVPGGGKLLLVIDQFEQWLYAHEEYSGQDLTNALLQCDGETIQAIVMVREDFWISVSRFLRELDTPILERENSAMVDLFDLDHAKKVLSMFGRAYEKLPDERSQWSEPQKAFLAQASEGLSENRKVISVRLALFSEMMKSREWTPASIEDVGGVSGVGVTFLEETFGQKHSPIQYRQHQEAVRGLLSALLPASGTDIKGSMQSVDSLKKAAGYEDKPREFEELMEILDKNLRLITPVDDSSGSETGTERSYQLAHDYMVPSLREWLTQKQRETKKGRAELKLAERAATWGAIKENRQLPSLWEWLKFRRWTDKGKWTKSESQLMSKTIRFHGTRIVFFTSVACLMIAFAIGVNTVETWNAQRASKLESEKMYKALEAAELDFYMNPVPHELKKLSALQPWINLKLKQEIFLISDDTEEKLKLNQSLLGSSSKASEKLQQELIGKVPYNDRDRLAAIERQANAAMALLRLNELSGQSVPDDSTKRQQHYYRLYGMILGLGEYSLDQLPSAERDGLLKTLETMYAEHPSRAIHSAVGWLLRRWGQAVEEKELAYDATGAREWYVIQVEPPKDENSQPEKSSEQEERSINLTAPIFFTMLVYPGGEFEMGDPGEQQRKSVPGPFAVSDREVTWRQFSAVDEDTRRKAWEKQFQQQIGERGLHPDEPVFGVNWFDAVYYCRWLTESKMPGERNQCYVKKDLSGSKDKMKGWLSFPSNTDGAWEWPMNPKRPGFRLLTEAEWEYVACGSIETRYSFGSSGSLLAEYGWFTDNSEKWSQRTRELRPSVAGVFDIHGNLWEWVDDWYAEGSYRMYRGGSWLSNAEYSLSGDRHQPRLTPGYRSINLGFRVALSPSGIPESPEADK